MTQKPDIRMPRHPRHRTLAFLVTTVAPFCAGRSVGNAIGSFADHEWAPAVFDTAGAVALAMLGLVGLRHVLWLRVLGRVVRAANEEQQSRPEQPGSDA